jgi:hypothetical protein
VSIFPCLPWTTCCIPVGAVSVSFVDRCSASVFRSLCTFPERVSDVQRGIPGLCAEKAAQHLCFRASIFIVRTGIPRVQDLFLHARQQPPCLYRDTENPRCEKRPHYQTVSGKSDDSSQMVSLHSGMPPLSMSAFITDNHWR